MHPPSLPDPTSPSNISPLRLTRADALEKHIIDASGKLVLSIDLRPARPRGPVSNAAPRDDFFLAERRRKAA